MQMSVRLSSEKKSRAVNLHLSGSEISQVSLKSVSGLSQVYFRPLSALFLAFFT